MATKEKANEVPKTKAAQIKELEEKLKASEEANAGLKKDSEDLVKLKDKIAAEKAAEEKKIAEADAVAAAELMLEDDEKMGPRRKRFICKVQHLMAEGKERENPIPVNDLGDMKHGMALAYPNKETVLSQVQINILRDAVEHTQLEVPDDSGIYEELNPFRAAELQFPSFTATRDRQTGRIMLVKEKARFAVEVIKPYIEPKKD